MSSIEIVGGANVFKKHLEERLSKPMPKCVKCGHTFGLYTYNEELWCPKCLVTKIRELESLLKEIWLENSGHIGTIRKGKRDKRKFIITSIGYRIGDRTIDFTNGVEINEASKETPFEQQCRMELEAAAGRGLKSGDPIE